MSSQDITAVSIHSIAEASKDEGIPERIFRAIRNAAAKTGVDFSYLMQKAAQESSFDPSAKASTSSATGLFQFTNQTWLSMVKNYGEEYGLGGYAAQIKQTSNGYYVVENDAVRNAILNLRNDPQISAEMAGELDKENAAALEQKVGGKIGNTELYLAHFLGAGGAGQFIEKMRRNPNAAAADILPVAAAANQAVFYEKTGEAKSLQQIYRHFAGKFDRQTDIPSVRAEASTSRISASAQKPVSSGASGFLHKVSAVALSAADNKTTPSPTINNETYASGLTMSSALFNTMICEQIQGTGLHVLSPLSAYAERTDEKKKDTGFVLSAAA